MMFDMCNFPPSEETAKHSSFDELSAKVKVLEAENESLKTFIQESSNKETEARKELSEKHARDLAEVNEKLEKSQGRVLSVIAKNRVLEAEAEAIDKLIFRKRFSVSLLRLPHMLSL
jgi:Fe2+ transport system protein B